jgi:hypothetical protein
MEMTADGAWHIISKLNNDQVRGAEEEQWQEEEICALEPRALIMTYACLLEYISISDKGGGKQYLLLQFTDKKLQPVHVPLLTTDRKQTKIQMWDMAPTY